MSSIFVPGRIEVLGKHVDYAGGSSLTCATTLGMRGTVEVRDDSKFVLFDERLQEGYETSIPPVDEPARGHWTRYPWTLVTRLARDFPPDDGRFRGATLRWRSEIPLASGLSSSSAFLILCFLALRESEGLETREGLQTELEQAAYLAAVESGRAYRGFEGDGGVGTRGGAQDQTAILCAQEKHLSHFSYDPHQLLARVPFPDSWRFVIGVSGVEARKTGNAASQYLRATHLAAAVTDVWNRSAADQSANLAELLRGPGRDAVLEVLRQSAHSEYMSEQLVARFEQFAIEQQEVLPAALEALRDADCERFGAIVDRSHRAAEDYLENQVDETIGLQRLAREHGAFAASAFGAGFGGAVWSLVTEDEADRFLARWRQAYLEQFPQHAESAQFLATAPGGPAGYGQHGTSA